MKSIVNSLGLAAGAKAGRSLLLDQESTLWHEMVFASLPLAEAYRADPEDHIALFQEAHAIYEGEVASFTETLSRLRTTLSPCLGQRIVLTTTAQIGAHHVKYLSSAKGRWSCMPALQAVSKQPLVGAWICLVKRLHLELNR